MVNWLDYKSKMFSYNFAVDEANKKYQKDYKQWLNNRPTEQEVEDNPLRRLINEFNEPTYSEDGKPVNPLLKYLPVPTKPNLEHLKPVKPEPQKFFPIIIIAISLIILFLFGGKRNSQIKINNENSLD